MLNVGEDMIIDSTAAVKIAEAMADYLSPDEVARAINTGLNKAAVGVRAQMVKRLGADVNLTAKRMKAVAPIKRSTPDTLEAQIIVKGETIPLVEYVTNMVELKSMKHDDKGNRKPVQIKIRKGGPTKTLKGGFLAPTYGNIMLRKGEERGPLAMMTGPPLAALADGVLEGMESDSMEIVEKQIARAIEGQIKRAMGVF